MSAKLNMYAEPLSFQKDAIQHHISLLESNKASAEGSVAGFGKTFVAAFVAKEMKHELVVACPKVVIPHWRAAAEACGTKVRCISNYEQHKLGHTKMGEWMIKNRQWKWTFPKPTLLVLDEAHVMKSRSSQNAKFAVSAKRQGIPTLVMSATLAQDPTDLFACGYLLGLHNGEHYEWQAWQARFGVIRDGFSFVFDPRHDPTALKRLNAELFPKRGHRKTYDEIPDFPSARTDVRGVDSAAHFVSNLESLYKLVQSLELLKKDSINAAVERLRARQIAEAAKVPAIIELAQDLIASGLSVPIFLNFKDSINEVAAALKCDVIDGSHPSEDYRNKAISNFQKDKSHVLILQIGAGGVGISLHDTLGNRPRHSLISPPENARDLIQALGRNRRVGQKSPAFRTIMTLNGSIENKVRLAVEKKANQIEEINDGDLDIFL